MYLYIYLSIYLSIYIHIYIYTYISLYLSIYIYIYVYIYLNIYVYIFVCTSYPHTVTQARWRERVAPVLVRGRAVRRLRLHRVAPHLDGPVRLGPVTPGGCRAPAAGEGRTCGEPQPPDTRPYKCTSLIINTPFLGPYSRTIPGVLRWS